MKRSMIAVLATACVILSPLSFAKQDQPAAAANKAANHQDENAATAAAHKASSHQDARTVAAASSKAAKPHEDKVSYALGVELGEAFKAQGLSIRADRVAQGMTDAFSGNKYQFDRKTIDNVLIAFRKEQISKQEGEIKKIAQENVKLGKNYMQRHHNEKDVQVTATGLQYRVLKAGTGKKPSASDTVTVNYEGKFIDGQVFDSSYQRHEPAKFRLDQVIAGWTEALQLMPEGSTWELVIPPQLAYGEHGMGGVIGPNETLVFKVELIKVGSESRTANREHEKHARG